ncbi:MAG: hypothetical protein GWP58_13880 [Gammaproteobacteria bacterium]|nr:hypothetical protein [Gammaproteobacteria bacterium]
MSSLKKKPKLLAGLALVLIFLQPSLNAAEIPSEATASGDVWRFRVFLDDREIGYHHFYVAQFGDTQQLRSEANFEYKLLFVKLFHYEHENLEIWSGDCLQSIESRTDANGTPFRVEGRRADGKFHVASGEGDASLPDCIMSFAYWNPSFLEQGSLLNTQDGEYLQIEVSSPVFEELEVRGEQRPSYRYRLAAGALNLDLWYSPDQQWLALESETEGGRILRYELF